MKFLFSDSLDFVDPDYDFLADRAAQNRRTHASDLFPHEFLDAAPYDGLLVSRAAVGDVRRRGKYSEAQAMRFSREGARAFLRFSEARYPGSIVMGDNGAFSYRDEHVPPFGVEDTLDFYEDGGFTHGCAVDHLIFDLLPDDAPASEEAQRRSAITLANAEAFLPASKVLGRGFTPVGVVQGWSPASMADAARDLVAMGYRYLALGGTVPLRIEQIARVLAAVREAVPADVRLHVLGFGKVEQVDVLRTHGVASFDTTSPLLRAFKDGRRNYYVARPDGTLGYHTAIRIPDALDNPRLLRAAKRGRLDQDALEGMERTALAEVRAVGAGRGAGTGDVEAAVAAVMAYARYALWDERRSEARNEAHLARLAQAYADALRDRPWERCPCRVCRESGVEAMIFRGSNRNKRRGMHNLHVFHRHLAASAARSAPDAAQTTLETTP